MRRRGIIVGTGVALSALAGCLGSDQSSLSERPAGNDVEDGVRTAIGQSNTVAIELSTARADAQTPADVRFDADALGERIASARSALESATQDDAASDYQTELDAAASYVDVVAGLLEGSASLSDVAGQLDGLESSMQSGNYEAAGRTLETVQPTVESARTTTSEAESTAQEIDAEVLDPYGAKLGELTEGLATVQNGATGAAELVAGYDAVLAGRSRLQAGRAAVERGDFATAESAFATARSQFETATDHFETARSETDGELSAQVDAALCRSRALTDASVHFEASASAAQSGNLLTAQNERQAGEADLQTAGRCGA